MTRRKFRNWANRITAALSLHPHSRHAAEGHASLPHYLIPMEAADLQLPEELWLEVLELLDHQELSRVAVTCKALQRLCIPLMNKEMHLNMHRDPLWHDDTAALPVTRLTLSFQYMFHVAFPPQHRHSHGLAFARRFVNLQSLTLRNFYFGHPQWKHFRQVLAPPSGSVPLPHLTSLRLVHCSAQLNAFDPPGLAFTHIRIEDKGLLDLGWSNLASPVHLKHLTITTMHFQKLSQMPCLSHLRFLHVTRGKLSDIYYALSRGLCPNLETLEIEGPRDYPIPAPVPPIVKLYLPKLRSYHGPDVYAPAFARSTSLVHASLWRPWYSSASGDEIIAILSQLAQFSPALKTLHLCQWWIRTSTLNTIRDFTTLDTLTIDMKGVPLTGMTRQDCVDMVLASKLPLSLQELRIVGCPPSGTGIRQEVIDAADRIRLGRLAWQYPNLRYASISGAGFDWSTYGMIP